MTPFSFDIPGNPPAALLDESGTSIAVIDLDGNPNVVIDTAQGFDVPVHWELTGALAQSVIVNWQVRLYAESIGAGFEGKLAQNTVTVPTSSAPGSVKLDTTLHVPPAVAANLVTAPDDDNVYQLVVVISLYDALNQKLPFGGLSAGAMIEVRKP